MENAGNILSILFLGVISWQDFQSRSLSAWLLPVIGVTLLIGVSAGITAAAVFQNSGINLLILVLYFGVISLWTSFRNRTWVNIVNTHVGLGDILLLVAVLPVFSPLNFCLFFTCGSIFALVGASFSMLINPKTDKRIPLAGYLSVLLISFCILRIFMNMPVHSYSDEWLTSFYESSL